MSIKSEKTKTIILKTASAEFSAKGFDGGRMDEIADKSKVNKATIYYHIGGKEELYEAVISDVLGNYAERLSLNVKKSRTFKSKIYSYILTFAEIIKEHPHIAPMMLREVAGEGNRLTDDAMSQMGEIIKIIREILKTAKSEGYSLPEKNPVVFHALTISSLLFFYSTIPVRERASAAGVVADSTELNISLEEFADSFARILYSSFHKEHS
ncbi:TetR/AcrR family transcriptional regulator [Flexistipes sp.]|uniref:TetR/AcrR family transcriptional regulator n=1 Tax=Flexistipes sp. TaxID=3088135 RepID=UPI002E21F7BB|nr:TetR/AcrR family transcriptional regulator [Flexistipes sp.]